MKKITTIAIAGLIQFAFLLNVQADSAVFSETFDGMTNGRPPSGWSVSTNTSTDVYVTNVPSTSDKSLQLYDDSTSGHVEAWVGFSSQQGPLVASWTFKQTGGTTAGEGHHMALLAGDKHAVELFIIEGNLVYRDLDGTDHVLQVISKDTWYDISVVADPTHFTADVYVDGTNKLTDASFQHTTTRLNGILFGSSDAWGSDSLYVSDITISKADPVLNETFNTMTTGNGPNGWTVTTNAGTTVDVYEAPSTTNKSMRIHDANASGYAEAWKSFDQQDRPFTASWNFMLTGNEEGQRMQLLSGTTVVFELATDSAGTLRYTRPRGTGYDLGIPTPNVWHQISVTLNLAARKADIYMDGVLKWEHRELLNTSVTYIDRVLVGSSNVSDQYDLYVDDVTIDADPVYAITPLDPSTLRLPIVLKLDDLSTLHNWWVRATDFVTDRQLSISPGLISNSLNSPSSSYTNYLHELYNDPSVEIFFHGYDHIDPEFQGTSYTYQKNHFEWSQTLAESTFGSRLTVFGATFNKTDTNTVQVLSEDPDIQIWLFCNQTNLVGKTPLYRVPGVNIEESTFIPDPEAFVTGYKANADANDYFVIQGHPANWTDARWYNFVRLVDYLEDNNIPTMTPSALVSMLSGPDTTPPSAPTGFAATGGDNTVWLDWANNSEPDLDGYTVSRSTTSATNYTILASDLATSDYADNSVVNDTTYYYVVTATDTSTNESTYSTEVSATPVVDTMPTVNAIGYWRLEDGTSGNEITSTADSSTNGLTATQYSGNEVAAKYSSVVPDAYVYDPVAGTYVTNTLSMLAPSSLTADDTMLLASDAGNATGNSFTFEMFFKVTDANGAAATLDSSSNTRLFNIDGPNGGMYYNMHHNYENLRARTGTDPNLILYNSSTDAEDAQWHHIAFTCSYDSGYDQTTVELFYDYVSLGAAVNSGAVNPYNDVRFGADSGADGDYNWYFDEARLSDGLLTTNQFLQVTNQAPDTTPSEAASLPSPADLETGIAVDTNLSWIAGGGATSHNVYFGASTPLTGADLQANQASTTYDPGALAASTTYYWRIDEVNAIGTTTGAVWSFTTLLPAVIAFVSGSDFILFWDGGGSYTVLTNVDLTNTNGWGISNSGTSPMTNAIGREGQLFYKLQ